MQTMYSTAQQLVAVYFGGITLESFTAQTFFERVVQASRLIPIPKDNMELFIAQKLASRVQGDEPTQKDHDEAERDIEVSRIVASILGLAAVTAVNFSQGRDTCALIQTNLMHHMPACAIVVDFYLDDNYKEERAEIVRLSTPSTNNEETEEERQLANTKIAGYIYEALRSCLSH